MNSNKDKIPQVHLREFHKIVTRFYFNTSIKQNAQWICGADKNKRRVGNVNQKLTTCDNSILTTPKKV